ncbi:MAG: T9SS C-terminal target domain-containing protein, partial [Chitinophagia bacterium]|nr:T9SS C-terminal target domain-containing protein [Chitinophagia bacterium]
MTKSLRNAKTFVMVLICLFVGTGKIYAQYSDPTAIAGSCLPYYGGAYTAADTQYATILTTDSRGNIYFVHRFGRNVHKISPAGVFTTVAGNGTIGYSGDGGAATAASISAYGIAVDGSGNVFFTDRNNHVVRKVATTGIITTIAGTGRTGYSGDGGPASSALLASPSGLTVDRSGAVYICDDSNHCIRKIDTAGIISTIAGTGSAGFSGDGSVATAARLFEPKGIHADNNGNLFIADYGNNRVRKIDTSGMITTVAGTGRTTFGFAEGPATAVSMVAMDVTTDRYGKVFINSGQVISILDNNGYLRELVNCFATTNHFEGFAVDTGNNFFFTGRSGCIEKMAGGCSVPPVITGITVNGSSGVLNTCPGKFDTISVSCANARWVTFVRSCDTQFTPVISSQFWDVSRARAAGTGTITLVASNVCGTDTSTLNYNIYSPPAIPAALSSITVVNPGDSILVRSATSGGVWSTSNGYTATVTASGSVHALRSGTATVSYTVSNAYCSSSATRSIVVAGASNAGVLSGASKVCIGSNTALSSTRAGGSWSSSYAPVATVNAVGVVYGVTAGTVVISYVIGGSLLSTRSVTVIRPTIPGITGLSSMCPGASTVFLNSETGGNWSNTNSTVGSVTTATGAYTASSSGADTIRYTVVNSCGSVSAIKRITVTSPPTVSSISGTLSTICNGRSYIYTNSTRGGVWAFSNPTVATIAAVASPSVTVRAMAVGTDTLSYTVTSTGTCGLTTTVRRAITVNTVPTIGAGTTASVLIGGTITLTNSVSGGTWSTVTPAIASVVATTGVVRGRAAGLDTIKYSLTNTCGTSTAIYLVTVTASKPGETTTVAAGNDISVYPNPSTGLVNVELSAAIEAGATVNVTNTAGVVVYSAPVSNQRTPVDMSNYAAGMYYITLH